jgi:hypothetical protein
MEDIHGVQWSELVKLEPELDTLLTFARMVGDAWRNWRDVEKGWGQFKNDIARLVGFCRKNRTHPVLGTRGAYEVVYWKLHNAVASYHRAD